MNLIFLGTPDFSVKSLENILKSRHRVLAVVTQPDKPAGRGGAVCFSPVKKCAAEHGVKILQFDKIRAPEAIAELKALNPDIMVTCAFGQILSREVLDVAPRGVINVHASLLPKYRGAAPIQWSIINGDKKTGVTIMQTEEGVDTGDIILSRETNILPDETAGELFEKLSVLGAELIVEALNEIEDGTATFTKQNNAVSSHVKMLKKQDGLLDFNNNSETLVNFIRGMNPWPCAFTFYKGKTLKVFKAMALTAGDFAFDEAVRLNSLSGSVVTADRKNGLTVKTKDGALRLCEIQTEGGKRMSDLDFLLGHAVKTGEILGENGQAKTAE